MVYFQKEGERKKRKERDKEKIKEVDVKENDGFVTVPCYAMRCRGKNEIEGRASLFSLFLSQSFFKRAYELLFFECGGLVL